MVRAVATGQVSGSGRCYTPRPCFAGRPLARATLRSLKTTVGGWLPGGRGEVLSLEAVPGQRVLDALSIW